MKIHFTFCLLSAFIIFTETHAQNLLWAKRMGSKLGDSSYGIAVDGDGNVYSTGSFSLTADFDPGPDSFLLTSEGQRDVYISKLDKNGNFVWADNIRGKFSESAYALALDPSGYIYITGPFRDTVNFDPSSQENYLIGREKAEVYLAKYDFDGKFIWANKVTRSLDTVSSNVAYGVAVDLLGHPVVFGRFGTSADFNPGMADEIHTATGDEDIIISKFDDAGNFIWVKVISGQEELEPYAIAVDGQGNILCTGNFSHTVDFDPGPLNYNITSQDSLNDAFILKLNSSGEFNWVKQISGPTNEFGNSIAVDPDGNSYTGGSYASLTDFNYGGDPVLLPTGSQKTGNIDGYILALDAGGNFQWVKRFSGPGDAEVYGLVASPGSPGGVYVVGYFDHEMYVDDTGIPPIAAINNSTDIFYSSLDHDGNFKFLSSVGGPAYEFSQAITASFATSPPTIYSTGFFSGTCDFDPGPNPFPISSAGSSDIYLLKMEDLITNVENLPKDQEKEILIYPNPANNELEIKTSLAKSVKVRVLNGQGMQIQYFESDGTNEPVRLNVSAIPSGIYFIQVIIDHQLFTEKSIILH